VSEPGYNMIGSFFNQTLPSSGVTHCAPTQHLGV
jgi:hypothetical protein